MSLNKQHARKIAKKLKAEIEKSGGPHDLARIYHEGVLIATFGIRRGSNKDQGHDHIPDCLHIRPNQARQLANCPLSREGWLNILRQNGFLDEDDSAEEPDL